MAQDTLSVEGKEEKKEKEVTFGEKREDKMLARVKERLSVKKTKKDKKIKEAKKKENCIEDLKDETQNVDEVLKEEKNEENEGKKEGLIQKIIKLFSSKKKINLESANPGDKEKESEKPAEVNDEVMESSDSQTDSPSIQVPEMTPAPKPPSGRASFLRPPQPPCSTTYSQSRPISQLDAALKQFKVSTAASRENLRSSHQDLSQVRSMTDSLSRNNSLRRSGRPPLARPSDTPTTINITLSASLTDLRRRQGLETELGGVRTSLCVN